MPVFLDRDARGRETDFLDLGLVNNMPDRALESTQRQFFNLLGAASGDIAVRLSLYALPEVPRSDTGRSRLESAYHGIESLWERELDGLIVTGTEPQTPHLEDEPYWGSLIETLEWADRNTHSTILSCLSAHAATLHFDGIGRRRLDRKRFGVFDCAFMADHFITSGGPRHFRMPHSRWNEIPENELAANGYLTLSRLADGGADAFLKQRKSMFVFFQGHPEYEAETLFLEYRRDAARYLRGKADSYPGIPRGYLDEETVAALAAFEVRATRDRRRELIVEMPAVRLKTAQKGLWGPAAVRMYRNWLAQLYARRECRLGSRRLRPNAKSARAGV